MMQDNEEKNIKKLLQKIDLDTPSDEFTNTIMSKINNVEEVIVPKDQALIQLLKTNVLEEPSSNFTYKVMEKLTLSKVQSYKPVISKKGWILISVLFSVCIALVLILNPTGSNENTYVTKLSLLLEKGIENFTALFTDSAHIPSLFLISILCLSILLFLDSLLRIKRIS